MRKRISKQKDIKTAKYNSNNIGQGSTITHPSPMLTLKLLLSKTECLQQAMRFEKERIDKIVRGTSLESIKFQQIQKNCCFQQFLKKYHSFDETKYAFTDLISKNALVSNITFIDFKLKNFIIMNNYVSQLKRIRTCKDSADYNLTASRSSTKEGRYFKEMEIQVKRMTNQGTHSRKNGNKNNASASFANLLIKNIERMLKNYRDPSSRVRQLGFKPILTTNSLQEEQNEFPERLHTSPQSQVFDAYGLELFREKHLLKLQQISQMSCINKLNQRSLPNTESQDTLRYQTEYDTEKISSKKEKSKKNLRFYKSPINQIKSPSKSKVTLGKSLYKNKK